MNIKDDVLATLHSLIEGTIKVYCYDGLPDFHLRKKLPTSNGAIHVAYMCVSLRMHVQMSA
jgi:hypothetical protein